MTVIEYDGVVERWCGWCGDNVPPRPFRGGRPSKYCSLACAEAYMADAIGRGVHWREREGMREAIKWFKRQQQKKQQQKVQQLEAQQESGRRGGQAGRGPKKVEAGRLGGLAGAAKRRNDAWWEQAARCVEAQRSKHGH